MCGKMRMRTIVILLLLSLAGILQGGGWSYASEEAAFRHNEKGIEYLRSGDFERAVIELTTALRYSPSSHQIRENIAIAYNNHGFQLMERGRLDLALDKFQNAYNYFSENPYTVYNLGRAYYQLQDIERAERYLSEAYELDPGMEGLGTLLQKVRRERTVESAFRNYPTQHFIISASDNVDISTLSSIRGYLSEAYRRVGMLLDHYPENKVVVLLYSEEEYERILGDTPYWALAVFDGKMRIPAGRLAGSSLREIIYHEYAHAVVHDIAGDRCPRWLNEGIAGKAESLVERRDERLIRRYLERYGLIPFAKLPEDFSEIRSHRIMTLVYMQSYVAVEFLMHRHGRGVLREILESLRGGYDMAQALYMVMGDDINDLERRWRWFVRSRFSLPELKTIRS